MVGGTALPIGALVNLGNPDRPVGGLSVRTPPGVELRPLGRDDFSVALELVAELYDLPKTDADAHRPRYDALIGSVDATPFLALFDGDPAGIAIFRFRRRLGFARFQGWLSDLYVRPAFRGRGIGRVLLQACLEEWRLRQGVSIMLETGASNVAARSLYESMGFAEAGKHFQLRPVAVRGLAAPAGLSLRPMELDDFEAVTRLLGELGVPVPSEERVDAVRRTFVDHVRRADTASLVAVGASGVLGVCTLELREPFFTLTPQAWIPEFVVAEREREQGIGGALLDAALAEAAARGAYAAVLESGPQRASAHRLYQAAGFDDVGSFYVYPS
jgi:ribosomal protein S18 acetylase RimI-like enzyme